MNKTPIDALIIGAGPCGIFQAFQLGLQGIQCHIIESRESAGGQCNELYADKPIYDIPGVPHILAGDLANQLLTQLKPFNTQFHFNTTITDVKPRDDSTFTLHTDNSTTYHARHVIVASGAGAFTPVKLRLDNVAKLEQKQLFYTSVEASQCAEKQVIITGDTPAAIEEVIKHHSDAKKIIFIHRKRRLPDVPNLVGQLHQLEQQGVVEIIHGKITEALVVDNRLTGLRVIDNEKQTNTIEADILIARLGNSPKMQDYTAWGVQTTRRHIDVGTAAFESSVPGLYAIGDINQYAGKRKLILCGFHEATLVAFAIAAKLNPQSPIHTQYTTTSTQLLKRLGKIPDTTS